MKTLLALPLAGAVVVGALSAQTEVPELIIPDGHIAPLARVVLSPDEKFIFTLSADETVRLWDFATGAFVRTFQHASHSLAVTPNGKFLVTGSPYIFSRDSVVRVWRIDNGMMIRTVPAHDVVGLDATGTTMVVLRREHGQMTVFRCGVLVGGIEPILTIDSATAWTTDHGLSRVAFGFTDGRIEFVDLRSRERQTLRHHAEDITQLFFTRDGRYLISGAGDRLIHVYDLRDRVLRHSLWANFNRAFCVDPTTSTLWSASFENTVDQFDLASGSFTGLIDHHAYSIASMAVSQDGELLVEACTDKRIRVIHVPTRRLIREIGPATLFVSHLSLDASGEYLVSSGFDHRIRIWNIHTGQWIRSIPSQNVMKTVVLDSLGWMVSTVAGPSLDIKTWPGGDFLRMRGYHEFLCYALAVSPSQKWIATGGYDRRIHVYAASDGPPVATMTGHRGNVMALTFGEDERVLFSASFDESLIAWSIDDERPLWTIRAGLINELIPGNNGTLIGGGQDGWIYEWKTDNGTLHRKWKAHSKAITSLVLHRNTDRLITASEDATVGIWKYSTGQREGVLEGHRGAVNSVVVTPDGRRLATAGHEGSIRLWDMVSMNLLAIFVGLKNDEWLTVLSDGRYFGSSNADEALYYRLGSQMFGMRQFAGAFRVPIEEARLDDLSTARVNWSRPPMVEIVRPYATPKISDGTLKFEVNAQNDDPLNLRLYLNNELIEDRRVDPSSTVLECVVRLRHGHNQIRVVGVDDHGLQSRESKLYVYYE